MTRLLLLAFTALLSITAAHAQPTSGRYGPGPLGSDLSSGSVTATGGTASQTLAAVTARVVYPEQFGAGCTTATDSTTAMQAALNTGRMVKLKSDCVYKITTRLVLPINPSTGNTVGIEGPGRLYFPAASFTNTSLSDKTGPTAVFMAATGNTSAPYTPTYNVAFRNFTMQSEVSGGRVLRAIRVANAVNVEISGVEIYGLPIGRGIMANTVIGFRITNNYIHDFTDNSVWGAAPQSTAIETDDDRVNGVSSQDVVISGNQIERIQLGAIPTATYGTQTDGINVQISGRTVVTDNTISDVGDGIDFWGSYGVIANNTLYNTRTGGIKLIHSASYNTVVSNVIRDAGLWGIVIGGNNTGPTGYNVISYNVISNVNPQNDTGGASGVAAISMINNGVTYNPSYNTFIGNTMLPGTYGVWAFFDAGFGTGNVMIPGVSATGTSGLYSAGATTIQQPLNYVTATQQRTPNDLNVAGVTASTSATTGALTVAGGVGISGDTYTQGIIRAGSTTASTSTTTGAIRTQGGLGVEKSAYIGLTLNINSAAAASEAITIGGNDAQIKMSGTGTNRINSSGSSNLALRVNSLDALTLNSSTMTIGIPLGATPGGLQPLCFNAADGRVYKAVAGVC